MNAIVKRLKSKTYRLGIAVFLLGCLEAAQATGMVPALFGEDMRAAVTVGIALAIFILREMTTGRVSDK